MQGELFLGRPGLTMLNDAYKKAFALLNVTSMSKLELHPDFLFVSAERAGKKSIGVDESALITKKAGLRPSMGGYCVIIIDGIDSMTIPAQNKILKVLEDFEHVVVYAVAYSENVLPTICSRMKITRYNTLSYEEFKVALPNEEHIELLYALTGGSPGGVDTVRGLIPMFQVAKQNIADKKLSALFQTFHMVKEKDKTSLAESEHKKTAIRFLEYSFYQELEVALFSGKSKYSISQLTNLLKLCSNEKVACSNVKYSKDNFFQFVMHLNEEV